MFMCYAARRSPLQESTAFASEKGRSNPQHRLPAGVEMHLGTEGLISRARSSNASTKQNAELSTNVPALLD